MSESNPTQVILYGTPELMAKLNKLSYFSKSPRMRALLEDAGNAYVLLAQTDVPKQTRFLKSSIHHKVIGWNSDNPGVRVGAGGAGSKYAFYVEVGTRPSIRYARNRRFMHWFMEGAKTLQVPYSARSERAFAASMVTGTAYSVFAKKVKHPGTKPQPFFFKHFPLMATRFMSALARLLDDDMKAVGESPATGPRT